MQEYEVWNPRFKLVVVVGVSADGQNNVAAIRIGVNKNVVKKIEKYSKKFRIMYNVRI